MERSFRAILGRPCLERFINFPRYSAPTKILRSTDTDTRDLKVVGNSRNSSPGPSRSQIFELQSSIIAKRSNFRARLSRRNRIPSSSRSISANEKRSQSSLESFEEYTHPSLPLFSRFRTTSPATIARKYRGRIVAILIFVYYVGSVKWVSLNVMGRISSLSG